MAYIIYLFFFSPHKKNKSNHNTNHNMNHHTFNESFGSLSGLVNSKNHRDNDENHTFHSSFGNLSNSINFETLKNNQDSISMDDSASVVGSVSSKSTTMSNLSNSISNIGNTVIHALRIDRVVETLLEENPEQTDLMLGKNYNEINAHFIGDRARTRLIEIAHDDEQFRIFKQQLRESGVTTTRGAKELVFACQGNI